MAYNLPLKLFDLRGEQNRRVHNHSYHLPTDLTDVTLGASSLWLGIQTGACGTPTLAAATLDSTDNRSVEYTGLLR